MRLVFVVILLWATVLARPALSRDLKAKAHTAGNDSTLIAPVWAHQPPDPGECVYSQPGVKLCTALLDGQGAFDVFTSTPAFLYVRTEEPVVNVIPPDPHYFQTDRRENTVVIVPTRDKLPERTPAVITTKSLTITLNVRPGSHEGADTQLTVLDPMRNRRNAQLAEAVAALEPKLVEKIHAETVDELARGGAELRSVRGKTIGRNAELIVLRATQVLTAGAHRYLFFSLQNRSADPFQVKAVHLTTGSRGDHSLWRMTPDPVAPGSEARGVVELPSTVSRGARLELRVEEIDARRSVELPKLEMP